MSQTPTPTGSMFTDMSSSTAASPMIAPLHEPKRSALVVKQQLPLGAAHPNQVIPGQTVDHSIPGASLGQKALLAKKFAKANKPSTVSPTDAIQSPCTAKLNDAKHRRFAKGKPTSLGGRLAAYQDENSTPQDKA